VAAGILAAATVLAVVFARRTGGRRQDDAEPMPTIVD
jgi:hypothetical protein